MTVGHITLNGQQYMLATPISNSYQRQPYNPMAAQLGQGGDYDDLQEWSAWLMRDWRVGVGQKDAEAGGFRYAELDSRFKQQLILSSWPRVTHLTERGELYSRTRAADITVDGTTIVKAACQSTNTAATTVKDVWFFVEAAVGTTITAELYDVSGGAPNTLLSTTTAVITETTPGGHWQRARFSPTVSPGGNFFIALSGSASFTLVAVNTDGSTSVYNGSTWSTYAGGAASAVDWSETDDVGAYLLCVATDEAGIWCAGDLGNGKIYRSTDNGLTWAEIKDTTETNVLCVATDRAGIWCAGTEYNGEIWRSADDGATWSSVHDDIGTAQDDSSTNIYRIATDEAGVWCATAPAGNKILRSSDDGANWADVEEGLETPRGIATDKAGIWIATNGPPGAGYLGSVYRSTDDGANFTEVTPTNMTAGYSIATDEDGVWCVGCSSGQIWRSSDDGATWTKVYEDGTSNWFSIATDGNGIWTVVNTYGGTIYRSADNGLTWALAYSSGNTLTGIATDKAGVWCAVASSGRVFRSVTSAVEFLRFYDGDGLGIATDASIIISFNGQVYAINDNDMWKWSDSGNVWTVVGAIGASGAVSAAVFDNNLYIGCGANGLVKMNTSESFSLAAGTLTSLLLSGKGYLWRAYQNDYYYSVDGTSWTGPIEVGPDDFTIRGMAGMGDAIYFSTDEALWASLFGDVVQEITRWGVPQSTNGRGMIHYAGELYIPVGKDVLRLTPGHQILNMGLNTVESLPSDKQGPVYRLASLNNWLIALIDPTQSTDQRATAWAWDGDGWHHLLSLPPGLKGRALHFQTEGQYLWVGATDSTHLYPFRIVLPNDLNNPAKDNNSTVQYQPYGWLETDWFHGGLFEIQKDFESVYVAGEEIDSGQWVKVYWYDDDSTAWEYLGQITSNRQELRWSTAGTRPNSRQLKIGLLLYTDTANATPIVNAVRVKFHPMLTDLLRWQLSIRVDDDIQLLDNTIESRTPNQIEDALETVLRSVPPVTFVDVDGTNYTVKADSGALSILRFKYENSAKEYEGVYRITLRQVVAN